MARPGRKRKPAVARQPSGRRRDSNPGQHTREGNARAVVVAARVRHGVKADDATDQRAGYQLGILNLGKSPVLTDDEFRGAQALARLAGRFHAAYQTGRPTPRAAHTGPSGATAVELDPKQRRALLVAYNDACRELGRVGRTAHLAVWTVAIMDNPVPSAWHGDLKAGCSAMFKHLC